jgi:mannose-6-phosphate isomerase-like protein (cupin superfamily)
MTFVDLAQQPGYAPAGHEGVTNRLLAGRQLGTDQVSVWHGALGPGGHAEVHVHDDSVQIYIGLTGTCTVTVEEERMALTSMTAVTIAAGRPHAIRNDGPHEATLLVISSPALR